MSKRTIHLICLGVALCLSVSFCPHAQAANIIWVSDAHQTIAGATVPDDQGWVDLLRSKGYNVDYQPPTAPATGYWQTLDAAKLAALEAADLIIVSRDASSTNHANDATEVMQWNSVKTPLILLEDYLARSNRWLWINSTEMGQRQAYFTAKAVDPLHPIFAGVSLDAQGQVVWLDQNVFPGCSSYINTTNAGNGKIIAVRPDNNYVVIVEWAAGTAFYAGSTQTPSDKRMLFCAGTEQTLGSDVPPNAGWGMYNLTAEGEKMFLNAVKYMFPSGQKTGFTYQGRLMDGDDAADGLYDLEFALYDAEIGGTQKGDQLSADDLDVVEGYFTVNLGFGDDPNIFNGQARWLEITVRPGNSTDSFTTLSPRQEITPTPYALFAMNCPDGGGGGGADSDWIISGTNMYSGVSGNVGIGTTSPGAKLDVRGNISTGVDGSGGNLILAATDSENEGGQIIWNGAGSYDDWVQDICTTDMRIFSLSTGNSMLEIYNASSGSTGLYVQGNVGIGAWSPGAKLEVNGQVKITDGSQGDGKVLTSDSAGLASWQTLTGGGAGDNLGDHTARKNIKLDGNWLSGDGDSEGVYVDNFGNVRIGTGTWTTSYNYALGVNASTPYGVVAEGTDTGVIGNGINDGVYGYSYSGRGVKGSASSGRAVEGDSVFGYAGYFYGPKNYFSGNVGIGTDSPSQKLEVVGGRIVLRQGSKTIAMRTDGLAVDLDASDADLWIHSWSGNTLLQPFGRKVGIGTDTPGATLDVNGNVRIRGGSPDAGKVLTSDAAGLASWQTPTGGGGGADSDWIISETSMYSGVPGNVGIGTTTPGAKLDVQGQINATRVYAHTNGVSGDSSSAYGVRGQCSSSSGYGVYGLSSSGYAGYFDGPKSYFSGNVGIGVDPPSYKLDVSGAANLNKGLTGVALWVDGDEALWYDGTCFSWGCGGQRNYFYREVGIGITEASEMLDVDGTARLRSMPPGAGLTVVADGNGKLYKATSSLRYKTNIEPLDADTDAVLKLRPVRFQWKTTGQNDIGLIAEEVEQQLNDLVIYDNEGRPEAVKYDRVSLYLLKVVRAQQQRISELEAAQVENRSLAQRIEALEQIIRQQQVVAKEVQQ